MNATAWCRVEDVPGLHYEAWVLGSWLMAAVLGLTLHPIGRRHGRSPWVAAGIAVMSIPAWMILLQVAPNLMKTFCAEGNLIAILPGPPNAPSAGAFLSQAVDGLLRNVGYPAVGLLLYLHGHEQFVAVAGRTWSEKLGALVPMGRGLAASVRLGAATFPLLALANILLAALVGLQFRAIGASSYFTNMSAPAALALALAAGVGEELVFRGVMQQGLKHVLYPLVRHRGVATGLAIALQAIPFAYAHAGYGNPELLLFNAAFAILAGLVVETVGLGAAIALHVLIDLFAFFAQTPTPDLWFWGLIVAAAGGVVLAVVVELRSRLAGWRTRGARDG